MVIDLVTKKVCNIALYNLFYFVLTFKFDNITTSYKITIVFILFYIFYLLKRLEFYFYIPVSGLNLFSTYFNLIKLFDG